MVVLMSSVFFFCVRQPAKPDSPKMWSLKFFLCVVCDMREQESNGECVLCVDSAECRPVVAVPIHNQLDVFQRIPANGSVLAR